MRASLVVALGVVAAGTALAASQSAFAQTGPAQTRSPASETRYFTSIDGLMDGNADIILKEVRQGLAVTSAVLDVCYPEAAGSQRKDRFVVELTPNGQTLTGTTQSIGSKLPVTVRLTRRAVADRYDFTGKITVGGTTTEVSSTDNSDMSASEFKDSRLQDDNIVAAPEDFTDVSPETLAARVKLEAVPEFLNSLRGKSIEVAFDSLAVTCDALRAGEQTINLTTDPAHSAEVVAQLKTAPGVVNVGWTGGSFELERAIRFPAAEWRDGGKLDKTRIAAVVAETLSKSYSAKSASPQWDEHTGKLTLTLKRPSQILPDLNLTETIEIVAMVSPDRPGATDRLMLWLGPVSSVTSDEGSGPKLRISDTSHSEGEGEVTDDDGSIAALAKALKGQRWDSDRSAWK